MATEPSPFPQKKDIYISLLKSTLLKINSVMQDK